MMHFDASQCIMMHYILSSSINLIHIVILIQSDFQLVTELTGYHLGVVGILE